MSSLKAEELASRVLAVSPEQREGVLEAACGRDADLRKHVQALIEERERGPEAPTELPNDGGTDPETETLGSASTETIGGTIGPYKLLDELGAGGMGTVYLAE